MWSRFRGELDSEAARAEAVRIARETQGVTRVDDPLRIKGAGESVSTAGTESATRPIGRDTDYGLERPDLWITTKVQAKYFVDDEVRGRSIDVDTRGGVVTLRGTVDDYAARRQATPAGLKLAASIRLGSRRRSKRSTSSAPT